jgi:hypothetical protein
MEGPMRGLVFTEFLDFVESTAGPEMVETMLDACDLDSGGAYTAVGTYDHREMLKMLTFLHQATGQAVSDMVTAFGENLFGRLIAHHPDILKDGKGLLDFLEGIETHIHREVRKLYPDAELPVFEAARPSGARLVLDYRSSRPFADLALGMIRGAAAHFHDQIEISRVALPAEAGHGARFEVALVA